MKIYTMDLLQLQEHANYAVSTALRALEADGKLTCSAEDILERHAIVMHHKGIFGQFIDKLVGKTGIISCLYVKFMPLAPEGGDTSSPEPSSEEEPAGD